jgi:hypothetical protein
LAWFAYTGSGVMAGVSGFVLFAYLLISDITYFATCFAIAG